MASANAQANVQNNGIAIDIPAQPVASALRELAVETGANVLFAPDSVRGLNARHVRGWMTADEAARRLVAGMPLEVLSDGSGAVVVREAPRVQVAQVVHRVAPAAPVMAAPMTIETVVVTAQHKSENIQNVPIAVTALSQAQLTERQIAGGPDLVKEVPNLTFTKTNFTGYNLEIRGIGTQAISVTTDPAVAVAFNDIPFIRNHFFEQEFYDLQDAEVLRGPQGTLYGRNATAGVVNIKSALPTDQYEAMVSADIGNFSNRRLEGMINIPIVGDTLDLRLAGEWTRRDGYSFNTLTNSPIDGRDLWSSRLTVGWKPMSGVQTYVVWEHFYEDDDRIRSGKQLCKTAPVPATVDGVPVPYGNASDYLSDASYLSQGCEDVSLYSPQAFETPNGTALPYYFPLADGGAPVQGGQGGSFNIYASTTQSMNLRDIESQVNPTYKAKNDTIEWNTNWQISPALTLTSQIGYNNDFLWSTEDYDRFNSAPGAFTASPQPGITTFNPKTGTYFFCDPQLGCSDRLVLEDLSDEHAWQFSQEFRLASDFAGPFNFSVGGNYLHYDTEENYYVFINTVTSLPAVHGTFFTPWVPGVSDNSQCLSTLGGYRNVLPGNPRSVLQCIYIDPNSISGLNNEGHNYFLSQNPYSLNSYAMFGEGYYNFTNDLKLTLGARWTDDQKHFVNIPSELLIPGYGYPSTGVVNQEWERWTGRGVLDWTPKLDFTDQTLVYASVAHGYKAGGANPPGALFPSTGTGNLGSGSGFVSEPIHPLTFKPEYIEAFELGTKNTLLDNALTINGDIFYYNYTGYQISEIVDRTAINNNYNAHVEGAEFEMNWEPLPGLKFSFNQGFENAVLASGDTGIDLMDRTAGRPGWMVVKPYVTEASNCILPTYVVAALFQDGSNGSLAQACNKAYYADLDPVTGLPYVQNPSVSRNYVIPAGYPGFDPVSPNATNPDAYLGINAGPAPNSGEGFSKRLGGNQLPNAPHFTSSLTAEYSMPVSDDWVATFHTDFYWQSQQWARVFEDAIDKIHGYSNVNFALILTSSNGWQVMGYVKNVFDTTAITGTFLNSDDTGLTTNVFLTDPRLFGVRVTKQLDQSDGFWGSDYSGYDFFTNLFSDTDKGRPPLWIEFGGDFSNLSDASQTFAPSFFSTYGANGLKSPRSLEDAPHYGFDETAKLTYQPDDSDWVISAAVRYGRTGATRRLDQQFKNADIPVAFTTHGKYYGGYSFYPSMQAKFSNTLAKQSESHAMMDFLVGKDVGLGMLDLPGSSVISGGMRVAQFTSKQSMGLHAEPDLHYPTAPITTFLGPANPGSESKYAFRHDHIRFHHDAASVTNKESFHGLGPKFDWNASTPVTGDEADGEITVDWGLDAAVLFGRQKNTGHHQSSVKSYYLNRGFPVCYTVGKTKAGKPIKGGFFQNTQFSGGCLDPMFYPTHQHSKAPPPHNRSRFVAVPNLGGFIGLSVKYRNAKISFGYRADEFFGAMDGGIDTYKSENRGFFGPYANISIGLGG